MLCGAEMQLYIDSELVIVFVFGFPHPKIKILDPPLVWGLIFIGRSEIREVLILFVWKKCVDVAGKEF